MRSGHSEPDEFKKLISDEQVLELTRSFSEINAGKSNEPTQSRRFNPNQNQSTNHAPTTADIDSLETGSHPSENQRPRFNTRSGDTPSFTPRKNHERSSAHAQKQEVVNVSSIDYAGKKDTQKQKNGHIQSKIAALVLSIVLFTWLLPSGNVMNLASASLSSKDRSTFYSTSAENLLINVLGDIHNIPRTYVLEMSDTPTPVPDKSKFTKIDDDQRKNFDGSPIDYYKDDTIEVKCWKEKTKYGILTYAEVWIAHPSQFRRTIVDNIISKKHKDFPENIFRKTNGVLGMSGDYCAFRPYGIEIQYGNLIRDKVGSHLTPKMDILVYDINGNFSIYESTNDFFNTDVYKNGQIIHTFAFGPMLIDDYQVSSRKDKLYKYQNGSPGKDFPRAAVCQFDYDKHYLLCRLGEKGTSLEKFATEIQKKGVRIAYALDGGQTGTIMFNKEVVNEPAYTGTREMSDIFYFATAVPND